MQGISNSLLPTYSDKGARNSGTMAKEALKTNMPTWPTSELTPNSLVMSLMPTEYADVARPMKRVMRQRRMVVTHLRM